MRRWCAPLRLGVRQNYFFQMAYDSLIEIAYEVISLSLQQNRSKSRASTGYGLRFLRVNDCLIERYIATVGLRQRFRTE